MLALFVGPSRFHSPSKVTGICPTSPASPSSTPSTNQHTLIKSLAPDQAERHTAYTWKSTSNLQEIDNDRGHEDCPYTDSLCVDLNKRWFTINSLPLWNSYVFTKKNLVKCKKAYYVLNIFQIQMPTIVFVI